MRVDLQYRSSTTPPPGCVSPSTRRPCPGGYHGLKVLLHWGKVSITLTSFDAKAMPRRIPAMPNDLLTVCSTTRLLYSSRRAHALPASPLKSTYLAVEERKKEWIKPVLACSTTHHTAHSAQHTAHSAQHTAQRDVRSPSSLRSPPFSPLSSLRRTPRPRRRCPGGLGSLGPVINWVSGGAK